VLFPIVGRLKNDSYTYKNQKYNMTQHGFARDCEFSLVSQSDNFLEFKLSNDEKSLEIYPFLFDLYISYKLEQSKLIISYKVKNNSNDNMPFSIGAHPAFNWTLNENEKKEDYFLEFENIKQTKRYFFKDDALIFNDPNIKNLTLKNINNKNFVKLTFDNFPYLGIWSKPTGAPFVCIEPWFGIADDFESNQNLVDKNALISLEENEIFSCFYSIEV
jgi:galactose mutarotase-like enzyme